LGDTVRALRPGWWAIALGALALIGWIWKIAAMRG
jgi:hypothetical protein